MYSPLGLPSPATVPLFSTCPHCSYLLDGSCIVCPDGHEHPSCAGCVAGVPQASPWWKGELVLSIAVGVLVSVLSTMAVVRLEHHYRKNLRR